MTNEWKLVPVKPTDEMLVDGYAESRIKLDGSISSIYRAMLEASPTPNVEPVAYPLREHLPDLERQALDATFIAMASKVYDKYLEGYEGFGICSEEWLNTLMHKHLAKGDPIDVANFCAFLFFNKQKVTHPAPPNTIIAKPLTWEGDGDEWSDKECGFHIYRYRSEIGEEYVAAWGEGDSESFTTLDLAKEWCQQQLNTWIQSVAIAPPNTDEQLKKVNHE